MTPPNQTPRKKAPRKKAPRKKTSRKQQQKPATNTKRGRPKGAKTEDRPTVEVGTSKCSACGCTDRSAYTNQRSANIAGIHPTFGHYTTILWRRCRCLKCGQARDDKVYLCPAGDDQQTPPDPAAGSKA